MIKHKLHSIGRLVLSSSPLQLPNCLQDLPPDRGTISVAFVEELIGAASSKDHRFLAVLVDHQLGRAVDVGVGYYSRGRAYVPHHKPHSARATAGPINPRPRMAAILALSTQM
jgi:hypothetical protein